MFKNYLKVAFRNLLKHKTFSIINILGFAFGISVCLLIILFLIKEYSYDSYNTNADYIYKLIDKKNNSSAIDYRIMNMILSNYPEVKDVCGVQVLPVKIGTSYNNNGYDIDNVMSTDNQFFKMFTTQFIYGSSSDPMPNPNSVVLTESSAHKLFGNKNPVGKEIVIWRRFILTVSGVIKDFPDNSSINANMIVNMENNNFKFSLYIGNGNDSSTYRYPFNIYLQFKEEANASQLASQINIHKETLHPYVEKAGLLPLRDSYLNDNTIGSTTKKGNPDLLRLFWEIALIVLILAIINYINLSIAQLHKRNKETGIRKTIGAGRKNIVSLFLIESLLVTFIAFTAAITIAEVALPFFSNIVNSRLRIEPLLQFPGNCILLLAIFLIGILSGIIPAIVFSSFNPVRVFNGAIITKGKKSYFRNLLIIFQFTISIALIFCIIVIQRQIEFVKHNDLGFDIEQLLRIDMPSIEASKLSVLVNKLREYPSIKNLSVSQGVPGNIGYQMGSGIKGKEDKSFYCIFADSSFLKTFKIQLIKGRGLLPGDYGEVCMINETAYKYFGWNNLNNRWFNNGRKGGYKIIGVVKDFHTASLHQPISPTCIFFAPQMYPTNISLRIDKSDIQKTITYVQKEWKEVIPDYPMDYQFYDEWFNQMYLNDERFANAIGLFALLAITISCLGILGLAIFASERRAKEIGIRKIHGASVKELMLLLNRDFIKWVLISFVIACPIGWYAMNIWLQDFAYRTELNLWIFLISGVIAATVAFITISWQTWRAATRNITEVLRYE